MTAINPSHQCIAPCNEEQLRPLLSAISGKLQHFTATSHLLQPSPFTLFPYYILLKSQTTQCISIIWFSLATVQGQLRRMEEKLSCTHKCIFNYSIIISSINSEQFDSRHTKCGIRPNTISGIS